MITPFRDVVEVEIDKVDRQTGGHIGSCMDRGA